MATSSKDLSYYDASKIPSGKGMRIGILVSEWNENITFGLRDGAITALKDCGVTENDIIVKLVPGSFELPLAAQYLLKRDDIDGVVCLGSVVQGETKHFDFVCQGTTDGVMNVSLKYNKPAIFGVLTDNTMQQGIDRSGGKHGNKGIECAIACIKMIHLKNTLT
ncbi:MAG: 6,7-dimethyl-8-ribityllumazine synthase [Flavobacteriales bacterium]|jgi:6,7-dimethyl-8-ribityllumazine synthase